MAMNGAESPPASFKPIGEGDERFSSHSVPTRASAAASRRSLFQVVRQQTLADTLGRFVGNSNTKQATNAFYQSAANVFVLVVGLIVVSLYYVFSAFLRPLLWAVLCGVFLFPLKRRASHVLSTRLRLMQVNDTPLWLGLAMMPVQLMQWASRMSEIVARKAWKSIVVMLLFLAAVYAFNHFPVFVALQRSLEGLHAVSDIMRLVRSYGYVVSQPAHECCCLWPIRTRKKI